MAVANKLYIKEIESYIDEFQKNSEFANGTSGLADAATIEEWLEDLEKKKREELLPEGIVPATVYLCVRNSDKKVVGMLQIRHRLNDHLCRVNGHIGYSVRKSERGKGYGKEQLRLALEECRRMGMERVLITCDKSNTPSARTILANGGILENEIVVDGRLNQRYWITL